MGERARVAFSSFQESFFRGRFDGSSLQLFRVFSEVKISLLY